MIARQEIPAQYRHWNARWHAPFGRTFRGARRLDRFPMLKAWLRGPFSFQPNNVTRTVEYPWAYHAAPIMRGLTALDIGGAHSGFQFALAKSGVDVTNVDPMVDYGVGAYCGDPDALHRRLNLAFRTNVRFIRTTIEDAGLKAETFDRIYCLSSLEHFADDSFHAALSEARRLLRPDGAFVLTVDLFLNLVPFTKRPSNQWGQNISIAELVAASGMDLASGEQSELYGFPQFSTEHVLWNLEKYLVGRYPTLAQMFVLKKKAA